MKDKAQAGFSVKQMHGPQRGFTLIEVAIAILILVIGTAAVMQTVPTSIQLNLFNRADSGAMVYAQRELNQMIDQPLSATVFTDADGNVCQLGSFLTAGRVAGSPVLTTAGGVTRIDYTQAPVAGYRIIYQDPNSATGASYDIRWAVIVTVRGTQVTARRLIVGAQRQGLISALPAATVDCWVQR